MALELFLLLRPLFGPAMQYVPLSIAHFQRVVVEASTSLRGSLVLTHGAFGLVSLVASAFSCWGNA